MLDPFVILAPLLLLPVVGLLRFIGCRSFSGVDSASVSVAKVTPETADLGPGETSQFQAFDGSGVLIVGATWSPNAPFGTFTAPNPFDPTHTKDTVTASSGGGSASANVTLHPITVVVTPSSAILTPGGTITFTALVNGKPSTAITWSANAPKGAYLAPQVFDPAKTMDTVTATSTVDKSAKGTATVSLIGGNRAQYLGSDIGTKGTWQGIYGSAGWALAGTPANIVNLPVMYLPSLTLPPVVFSYGDPLPDPPDPRGLQKPPLFMQRFADVGYDASVLTIKFVFVGYQFHRVAIYCVDWDTTARAQKIEILDTSQTPPVVLDTQNLTGFSGGQYLIWNLSGTVLLRITKTAGQNAVISGIFFD